MPTWFYRGGDVDDPVHVTTSQRPTSAQAEHHADALADIWEMDVRLYTVRAHALDGAPTYTATFKRQR